MNFANASTPTQVDETSWTLDSREEWQQGRTVFGGIVAATLTNAMAAQATDGQSLRSISMAFAAPIPLGTAEITTNIDRRGKNTTFTSATITTGDDLCTRAFAVFASGRESSINIVGQPPTVPTSLSDAEPLPFIEGVVPAFMQHFELRFGIGSFPFSGATEGIIGGYCRHREEAHGPAAILGLLDAWPPATLPMATGPVASSSITWTAHILEPDVVVGTDWFEFRYEAISAQDGYSTAVGSLSKDGRVVAWTEQLGAIFG